MLQNHSTTDASADQSPPFGSTGGYLAKTPAPAAADRPIDGVELELDAAGAVEHEGRTSELAARRGALMLDYLRVRLDSGPGILAELEGWLGERSARPLGWRGWYDRSAYVLDGGIVAWCSDSSRAEIEGTLVDLPGAACASLGDRLVPFLRWALDRGRVTRCDFAIDDLAGRLTPQKAIDAYDGGQCVTRWRQVSEIKSRSGPGVVSGHTVYFGSRKYQALVRIYDKRLEQASKGKTDLPEHWVRLELECKGKLADALCRAYFQDGSAAVVGQIARRLRFVEPVGGDSNKRRHKPAAWWVELLGSVEPGPSLLCGERPQATISRMAAWLERQAGPALATVVKADGGDLSRVFGILDRSMHRLQSKHYAALALVGVT